MAEVAGLRVSELFGGLEGKHCLVTGGGRGIGRMIAAGLVANGATVYICSRSSQACEEAAAALSGPGRCVSLGAVDLAGGSDACEGLAARLESHLKGEGLHLLVNNSGTSWGEPMGSYPSAAWEKLMAVNVRSVFELTRACLPAMRRSAEASGTAARVINVGSVAGIRPQPWPTYAYDTAKAAVHMLTVKLAGELAGERVTVNALAPGLVPSKMSNQLAQYVPKEALLAGVPLGRPGSAADMAAAVLYLAGKGGEWVTGHVLVVDGGGLAAAGSVQAKL